MSHLKALLLTLQHVQHKLDPSLLLISRRAIISKRTCIHLPYHHPWQELLPFLSCHIRTLIGSKQTQLRVTLTVKVDEQHSRRLQLATTYPLCNDRTGQQTLKNRMKTCLKTKKPREAVMEALRSRLTCSRTGTRPPPGSHHSGRSSDLLSCSWARKARA